MAQKKPVTYEQIVKKVRKTFENADAREIFEHVAIEVDIIGEGAGAFYFEVAERACVVEPYNYYNNDGRIIATADVILNLADGKVRMREAWENGLFRFEGNEVKFQLLMDKIKLQ
ncbi:MAG: SCP2 sterol-binding domain-containing protein [Lachnospiraceae bacterium]|nr:SCP2 sterol-binding domain-containing protein [Lachnospiraceae bacterium]